jgi:hypothetical protein
MALAHPPLSTGAPAKASCSVGQCLHAATSADVYFRCHALTSAGAGVKGGTKRLFHRTKQQTSQQSLVSPKDFRERAVTVATHPGD